MAELPFPGYDTMTDAQVRRQIAKRFHAALMPQLELIEAAIAFEDAHKNAQKGTHPELIEKFKKEKRMLTEQIDEGTQRWGGLDNG